MKRNGRWLAKINPQQHLLLRVCLFNRRKFNQICLLTGTLRTILFRSLEPADLKTFTAGYLQKIHISIFIHILVAGENP